ncbi:TonB family protein [Xanthocytophaga agilis]|uniref:TonB family protein n=1 Tax=Xanthocytophaga agilis TaxID=3048010 RepID=A0AAE3UFH6_9BACT|nr:TonB family protein [Xanthocytophaga agilis]MDJ1502426.1 TonB family protein [Xanthocytophaga agilis]
MQKNTSLLGVFFLLIFLSVPVFAQKKSKYSPKASGKTMTALPVEEKKAESAAKEDTKQKEEATVVTEETFPGLESVTNAESESTEEAAPAPVPVEEDRVYTVVEKAAEFPGGSTVMHKYIEANLHYPKTAKKANVTGKVFTKFLVEKDGSISEIHIVKSLGSGCDEEATRIIKSMPAWKPASSRGRVVRSFVMLTVDFAPAN